MARKNGCGENWRGTGPKAFRCSATELIQPKPDAGIEPATCGLRSSPNVTAAKGIEEKTDRRTGSRALPRICPPALPLSYRPVNMERAGLEPGDLAIMSRSNSNLTASKG